MHINEYGELVGFQSAPLGEGRCGLPWEGLMRAMFQSAPLGEGR